MKQLTVLTIDDNDDCNELVKFVLEQDTNWQVLTALNGKDGIELAKTHRPEVILLDIAMPQTDGIEVYKLLNSQLKHHSFVVIFFTAIPKMSQKFREQTSRDIPIIEKPFDITTLANRINKIWYKSQNNQFVNMS